MNANIIRERIMATSLFAKRCLINARIARQKAQIFEEWNWFEHDDDQTHNVRLKKSSAQAYRLHARELLKEIETLNGRLYSADRYVLPLGEVLDGFRFKRWGVYSKLYKDSMFRGVDPE